MTEVKDIPLNLIDPSPFQVRTWMDPEKLESLAESFRRNGQQRPIKVRPKPEGRYEIIYGHRAVKALSMVPKETARSEVVEGLSDEEIIWIQDAENSESEPESDWDYAKRFKMLMDKDETQAQIAERKGKSQEWVSRRLSMLRLDPYFMTTVIKSKLTEALAREILKAPEELLPDVCRELEEHYRVNGSLPRMVDIADYINYVVAVKARPDLAPAPELLREEDEEEEEEDELELEDSELDQIPDEERVSEPLFPEPRRVIVPMGTPEPGAAKPEAPSISEEERAPAPIEPRRTFIGPTPVTQREVEVETVSEKYPAAADYVADYFSKNFRPDVDALVWSMSHKFGINEMEARDLIREVRAQPHRTVVPPQPITKDIDIAEFVCNHCGKSYIIVHVEPSGDHKFRPIVHREEDKP